MHFPESKLPDHAAKLIMAYVGYYTADPKLLNELVTGACHWPPADTYSALADRARAVAADVAEVKGFVPQLCQLLAAIKVLEKMEHSHQLATMVGEYDPAVAARVTQLLGTVSQFNPGLAKLIAASYRQ